jgi:hypothetical protein
MLFKFVFRLRNVSKNKNFEFSHNLKWYIIRISFERVLRNIQKNLLLKRINGVLPGGIPPRGILGDRKRF